MNFLRKLIFEEKVHCTGKRLLGQLKSQRYFKILYTVYRTKVYRGFDLHLGMEAQKS
jgi:hypothetical protein